MWKRDGRHAATIRGSFARRKVRGEKIRPREADMSKEERPAEAMAALQDLRTPATALDS